MSLFGLGESLRSGTHKSLILSHLKMSKTESTKVEYYGLTRSYSQMGSAINSLIAAALVFFYGDYKIVFLAALVPYVINLVNLASYPKELDRQIKKAGKKGHSLLASFKSVDNIRVFLNSASFDAFFKTVKEYLQPILASLALSLPFLLDFDGEKRTSIVVGLVYFFIYILTAYSSKYAYVFVKKTNNMPLALNSTFLVGIVLIVFAGLFKIFSINILPVILFLVVFVIQNLRRPLNVSLISDIIPSEKLSTGLSVESQLKTILIALFSPIVGFLADRFGVGWALLSFALLMLALFVLIRMRKNIEGEKNR